MPVARRPSPVARRFSFDFPSILNAACIATAATAAATTTNTNTATTTTTTTATATTTTNTNTNTPATASRPPLQAYVIYCFFYYLLAQLGGEERLRAVLKASGAGRRMATHPVPLKWCLKPWRIG